MPLRYAGIGSRETPQDIQNLMSEIAWQLSPNWILHSGYADGADMAFFRGAMEGQGAMVNFIPWPRFNGAPDDHRFVVPALTQRHLDLAQRFHPAWEKCSEGAKKLHARNGCQILGLDLMTPVDMVICWTKGGLRGGGTGQALRIAAAYEIPIFDLAIQKDIEDLVTFTEVIETANT
jgi:hypothetical protein